MTIEQALAWADQTMNERLREARRTGNDHDYDAAMEGCIDILAAEVRRVRAMRCETCIAWDGEAEDRQKHCTFFCVETCADFGCRAWDKHDAH